MTDKIVTMRFTNRSAMGDEGKVDEMRVDRKACEAIAIWYGAYHGGDDYTLEIDGVEQELDVNGEIAF